MEKINLDINISAKVIKFYGRNLGSGYYILYG